MQRNNQSNNGNGPKEIPAAPKLPPRNPLLSLAEAPFSLEDIAPIRLVPVTPATPAVLQDEPEPVTKLDSFLGQKPQHPNLPVSSPSQNQGFQASQQPQQSLTEPQQPQKQSYFTSILSSLPSLSLITGQDDSRPKHSPIPSDPSPSGGYSAQQYGGTGYSHQEVGGLDFKAGNQGYSSTPFQQQQQQQPFQSPPLQSAPTQPPPNQPPPAFPPSGGTGSYRLGNQRRLKYAPPPDLTSTQQQYQPPPSAFPAQPNISSVPPTFFNPSAQPGSNTQQSSFGQTNFNAQPSSVAQSSNFSQRNLNTQPSPFNQPNLNAQQSSNILSSPFGQSNLISQSSSFNQPNFNAQSSSFSQINVNTSSNSNTQISPLYNQPSSVAHSSPYSQPNIYTPPTINTQSSIQFSGPSSQGSSLHSSFRSSPVTTPTSTYGSALPTSNNFSQNIPTTSQSQPQAIPARLPEPATPQNTPADVAFSGFSAYRQQRQEQQHQESNLFSNENSRAVGQLEAIQEVGAPSSDRTFSPISAAKVTEKLENLIAAEQNDDTLSVKSELSAEVAKITAGIAEPGKEKIPITEELTEIDLNASETTDSLIQSEQSVSFNAPEDLTTQDRDEPRKEDFHLNFFSSPESKLPPREQSAPNFYNPASFQHQQPLSDPFSFVQSTQSTVKNSQQSHPGDTAVDSGAQDLRSQLNVQVEQPKIINFGENLSLPPSSIWDSDKATSQPSILTPAFSTPTQQPVQQQQQQQQQQTQQQQHSPAPPTFFNPAQFTQPSSAFSVPISSPSVSHNPTAASAFNINISNSTPSSAQLPPAVYTIPSAESHFNAVPEPTGSATLSPVQMSVSPLTSRSPQETVPPSLENLAAGLPEKQMQYRPVYHHWFYRREVESKTLWVPFSMHDSLNLEEVHNSNEISPETKVATDGGRFDVEILRRSRAPVYWTGSTTEVRRCSWFYKGPAESRYTPYEESIAARLEEEFKQACTTNNWNRRVELNNGEYIIFHGPTVQAHYLQATTPELAASWGNNSGSEDNAYLQGSTSRPRIVKRGMDEFNIDEGEPEKVDHILFLIHGIGSVCDLKFRSVEEVVDEFRSIALQLVQSHYRSSSEQGLVNRIEVLPVSWHATLHSGIDKKLQVITLESIPKWRHFTNDTLLDILFYTSPVYCETIMQTVGTELNRLYSLFNQRNPDFCGNVYLGGHSLGSLIVFDLLCHQRPPEEEEPETNGRSEDGYENRADSPSVKPLPAPVLKRKLSKKVSYVMGAAGTGQPFINYPQLAFAPRAFFALGSPIGMFVTVRGIDNLGDDFVLPTCPAFFNIFHPFDPVAYRVESLINPEAHKYRPMLIPHHKGRKRMHLELKETMARVGADLKQKLLESVRNTWNSVYQLAMFHKQDNQTLEQEIEKVVEEQMNNPCGKSMETVNHEDSGAELKIGKLNGGRRIDYVLQEAPFEYINEYIFAMTSHVCYWESEDTMLLILKEIYGSMGIQTDAQLPQQSLSIERVSTPTMSASPSTVVSPTQSYGMDPTAPMSSKPVGPPPTVGFVRKS